MAFVGLDLHYIVVLLLTNGKDYYAMGAYLMLMAGGAVFLESLTDKLSLRWTLRPIMVPAIFWLSVPMFSIAIPIYSPKRESRFCKKYKSLGVLRWEDGQNHSLPQDFADMLGWKEMAQDVARAYYSLDNAERGQTIIFCDNYGLAGAVDYYGQLYHLPQAQSKEAGFILWYPNHQHFKNMILVTDDTSDVHNPLLTMNFVHITKIGSVSDPYAREYGTLIVLCKGANAAVNKFMNDREKRLREKY